MDIITGHVYRTKRGFWKIIDAEYELGKVIIRPLRGDPREKEWQEMNQSPDVPMRALTYGNRATKPTELVVESVIEDITDQIDQAVQDMMMP